MILHIVKYLVIMKIISFNCKGLPNHPDNIYLRPCVEEILNNNDTDIVCLQETWYSKQDLATLNTIHKNFHSIGAATVDDTDGYRRGHIPGGVAIMWRSSG